MHSFNYFIIPALFLINMRVDGATIANTLTSPRHPIRDSARAVPLLQNRQYRLADFSSDPASTTDQPALPDAVDTDDHPLDISSQDFLPRGSVFPSLPLGVGQVSARADRPVVNFRQLVHRADSGNNEENCDPTSFERRLDPGFSTNVMSDVLPNGSTRQISASDLPTSNLPAAGPPTSNLPATGNPLASNLPAGTFASSPMSNAVGTSNLMNSALGSGGVQDELKGLRTREIALSHGMGPGIPNLEMSPRDDDASVGLDEEDTDEGDMDDTAENADEQSDDADEDDAGESDELESRQHGRLSPSRLRERPHLHHGSGVAVPSRVTKAAQAMKLQKELVKKKSQGAVMKGVQDVHGAAAMF